MSEFIQIGAQPPAAAFAPKPRAAVFLLQGITLAWMLVEFGVSAYAAFTAHSPAMLAFGSDSLVELLSATVVLLQWIPGVAIPERRATRISGALLFVLAFLVATIAVAALVLRRQPETTCSGIAITIAALIAMPVLGWLKRREARRSGNTALAADAVQSATCAYLALITLAALAAVPLLIREGRSAWHGNACGCC